MEINQSSKDTITEATARALATYGSQGINVVPFSVVEVSTDTIFLYDFFMNKTIKNLKENPLVALTFWSDLTGIQIKGSAMYVTTGDFFTEAVKTMLVKFPKRTLRGIISIKPTEIFDVSADATRAGQKING